MAWTIVNDVIDSLAVGLTNLLNLYNPNLLVMEAVSPLAWWAWVCFPASTARCSSAQ